MSSIPVSMINEVMGVRRSDNSNLFVGLCGTMFVGSDRYPMVVTEVISKKKIRVSHLYDDDYEHNIQINEDGIDVLPDEFMSKYVRRGDVFTLRKNRRWIKEGHGLWETGAVHLGHADEYRDPSF